MKNGFVRGKRLYPAHYSLLMFTKGAPSVLIGPKHSLRNAAIAICTLRITGATLQSSRKKAINLSDYWDDVSPVRHARRKNRVANELPPIIFHRVMQISAKTPRALRRSFRQVPGEASLQRQKPG